MKKYIPVLILSITIAILFTYCKITNRADKQENTIAVTDNISATQNSATLPLSLKNNTELKLVNGKGEFLLDKSTKEQQTYSFRNDNSKEVFNAALNETESTSFKEIKNPILINLRMKLNRIIFDFINNIPE